MIFLIVFTDVPEKLKVVESSLNERERLVGFSGDVSSLVGGMVRLDTALGLRCYWFRSLELSLSCRYLNLRR